MNCTRCNSPELVVTFNTELTISVQGGEVRYVEVYHVAGVPPVRIYCTNCHHIERVDAGDMPDGVDQLVKAANVDECQLLTTPKKMRAVA